MSNLELIDPTGSREVVHLHAARLPDLSGKTVAMLSDDMWQAHRMLPLVKQRLEARFDNIRILKGVEVDILEDGALDYTPEIRKRFDFIIASVHNRFGQDKEQMTARLLEAMDDPSMAILGHPTGRLLLSRDPYPMDLDAILDKAAAGNIAIEINAHPQRLDLDWRVVRKAIDRGVTISIGADAHNVNGMSNVDLGLGIARKGWVTADGILNTRSVEGFLDFVRARWP